MKIINNMLIGGTLLCLPVLGFAAPPLVSFEDGTTNTLLVAGDSVEGLGTVHSNMTITSSSTNADGVPLPATLIESYDFTFYPALTTVAFSGPNPALDGSPSHWPNACLEDVHGDRVYWTDSARINDLDENLGGDKYARGFAVVQPYNALDPASPFGAWEIDIDFDVAVQDFFLTMFDFGDFNPFSAILFHAEMTAFDEDGNVVDSAKLEFESDGELISLLLQFWGDACSAADYRGKFAPTENPPWDPDTHMNPGYIGGALTSTTDKGIVRVEVRGAGHDPKIGFDSISFEKFGACNYTRGYWSNHEWSLPAITLGDNTYTYVMKDDPDIFKKANNGKDYGQLCAQLAAATLNCEGFSCAASELIYDANMLLSNNNVLCAYSDPRTPFLTDDEASLARSLSSDLDIFNNSNHCEEESSSE